MATKAEILEGLSEEQKNAVVNYHGLTALEALPGAGKTHTMVKRCQYMVKDGVPPSKILVFTFTKKAAEELKERIRLAIGPDADKMMISTYHSFCGKLLRRFAEYAGRSSNYSIYDEDDKKAVLDKIRTNYFKTSNKAEIKYRVVCDYISKFKLENLSPSETLVKKTSTSYEIACGFIYKSYEEEMRKRNAFDFDDLPYFAYRIANKYPEVRDWLASRYDYIMSDENQDANKQNLDFILLLGSKCKNIMVVGDTDQSIYGFRGADINNVMETYKREKFDIKFLSTNYRSTQTIVRAADGVIKKNKARINKDSSTVNDIGEKINIVKFDNPEAEASGVAEIINSLVKNNKMEYKDIAILCRLQYQSRNFEKTFLYKHIPFRLRGLIPFYCRAEIKDILAYLKLAFNPCDLNAFERVVNVPKRGIGKSSIEKILLSISSIDDIIYKDIETIPIPKKAKNSLKDFADILKNIKEMYSTETPINEILVYVINRIKYLEYLDDTVTVAGTLEEKRSNLTELTNLSRTFTSIEEFLNQSVLDEPKKDKEDDNNINSVSIMTMHGSKGLEYKTIFLCGINDEIIPGRNGFDEGEAEEERRLFYVAMTRAKKNLYITFPSWSTDFKGNAKYVSPSRFLKEIPKDYVKTFCMEKSK
jgi:DNA helicase-2/ATP-dependent DNA helicase PcrA